MFAQKYCENTKGQSEAVNRGKRNNAMAKRKRTSNDT
jgi:hypothetical protein